MVFALQEFTLWKKKRTQSRLINYTGESESAIGHRFILTTEGEREGFLEKLKFEVGLQG